MDQAEISLSDIKHFDLYSCFLQQYKLQKRIGYSKEKRFNGYGRFALLWRPWKFLHDVFNYGNGETTQKKPQSYGLLTANSWFITKHAALVMSTIPAKPFEKINNSSVQKDINSKAIQNFTETPSGNGKIDTYTVINGEKV